MIITLDSPYPRSLITFFFFFWKSRERRIVTIGPEQRDSSDAYQFLFPLVKMSARLYDCETSYRFTRYLAINYRSLQTQPWSRPRLLNWTIPVERLLIIRRSVERSGCFGNFTALRTFLQLHTSKLIKLINNKKKKTRGSSWISKRFARDRW